MSTREDYQLPPKEGFILTHFLTVADVERSAEFYVRVLGGHIVRSGEPTIIRLANSWLIVNVGGGPTDDKPTVTLHPPVNPNEVSSFLNIRVADHPSEGFQFVEAVAPLQPGHLRFTLSSGPRITHCYELFSLGQVLRSF